VQLINTDGMAFIGPGSEWLWTAISGVGLVVTFVAIYRQLRIMRNTSALEQFAVFEAELGSERMIRCELELLVALRDGTDPADLPRGAAAVIWRFWERTGALVRRGHLDAQLLWEGSGSNVIDWWRAIEPYARGVRSDGKSTEFLVNFEWMAQRMAEISHRVGGTNWFDDPALTREVRISWYLEQLRIEEALRAAPATPRVASPRRRAHSSVAIGASSDRP
jgi:hypothetical protein